MSLCSLPTRTTVQKILVLVVSVLFVVSLILTYVSRARTAGVFHASWWYITNKYFTEVSPEAVIFDIIWPIIYIWNLAGVCYMVAALFLPEVKSPVHVQPTLMSNSFLASYLVALVALIGWIFAYDRELMGLSLALLIVATGAVYVAVGISYKRVYDNLLYLEMKETREMLWLMRILIQNGLCVLAAWLTVATCLNMAIAIVYEDSFGIFPAIQRGPALDIEDGSSVVLATLFAIIILWYTLEHVIFEKFTRYTFSIYPVFILASAGQVAKLLRINSYRNFIFAVSILAFCAFALLFRIIFFIFCHRRRKATESSQ